MTYPKNHVALIRWLVNRIFLEAKHISSLLLWVPLSAQMLFPSNGFQPIEKSITAPIGAKSPTALPRRNTAQSNKMKLIVILVINFILSLGLSTQAQEDKPTAAFNYQIISICDTIVIQFFDATKEQPTSWLWNFPEGTPATSREENPIISFENQGTYTVSMVVTNAAGTDVLYDANALTINEKTFPINLPQEAFKCANQSLNLNIEENTSYNYQWFPNQFISDQQVFSPTFDNDEITVYNLTLTEKQKGCTYTQKITIKIHPPINLAMGEEQEICQGDSIQLSANTNAFLTNIEWSQPETLLNAETLAPLASPSNTTTYTLSVTDVYGCVAEGTQTININNENLTVNAGQDVSLCQGEAANLNVVGGTAFSWSPGISLNDSTRQSVLAMPTETTTYIVQASTQFCAGTDTITVFVSDKPQSDYQTNYEICAGDSIQLTNDLSNPNYSYNWLNADHLSNSFISEPIAFPTQNEIFTVVISNESNCTDTIRTEINIIQQSILETTQDTTICFGDTIQLSVTGGDDYEWLPNTSISNPNDSIVFVYPDQSTTYTVSSDGDTCAAKGEVTIFVESPLPINLGDDVSICKGSSIQLSANAGQTFAWSPIESLNEATSQTVIAQPDSTTTYIVQASDAFCSDSDTLTVFVSDKPESAYQEMYFFCLGDSIVLTNALSNESYTYTWLASADIQNINAVEPSVFPTQNTNYTVIIQDGLACVDTVQVSVEAVEQSQLNVLSRDTTICAGDTISLKVEGSLNYQWEPTLSLTNPNDSVTLAFPVETTTYTIRSGSGSCETTAQINIGVYESPQVNAGEDLILCKGDEIQLQAEAIGASNFGWSPETGLSNANIANPFFGDTLTTEYIITTKSDIGCTDSDTILVDVKELPVIQVSPNFPTICTDGSIPLTASGAATYQWLPVATLNVDTGTTVIASPERPTTYTIAGTDEFGCRSSLFITVDIVDSLNLSLLADTIRGCIDAPFLLAAYGAETYFWSPSDFLNSTAGDSVYCSLNRIDTLNYSVTGTDYANCTAKRNVVVITSDRVSEPTISEGQTICKGDTVLIEADGLENYGWSPLEGVFYPSQATTPIKPNQSQTYTVTGTDMAGCSYNLGVKISLNELPETTFNNQTIEVCQGENTILEATGGSAYLWALGNGIDENERTQPTVDIAVAENALFTVDIFDENNCRNTDSVYVEVMECAIDYKSLIYTAFSPNSDGYNDNWTLDNPVFKAFGDDLVISIFNRWGQLLFEEDGTNWQWDGTFEDRSLPSATYYYHLILNDELPVIHGTITLLR